MRRSSGYACAFALALLSGCFFNGDGDGGDEALIVRKPPEGDVPGFVETDRYFRFADP